MTDGPFRNLPLGGRWKKAANAMASDVFNLAEVSGLLQAAIAKEVKDQSGMSSIQKLKRLISDDAKYSLISGVDAEAINQLKNSCEKSNFNCSLFRYVECEVKMGRLDESGLKRSIHRALEDTLHSGMNGIKDHSIRVADELDVYRFNERCRILSNNLDFGGIENQLSTHGKLTVSSFAPKKIGLEHGPPL